MNPFPSQEALEQFIDIADGGLSPLKDRLALLGEQFQELEALNERCVRGQSRVEGWRMVGIVAANFLPALTNKRDL